MEGAGVRRRLQNLRDKKVTRLIRLNRPTPIYTTIPVLQRNVAIQQLTTALKKNPSEEGFVEANS
ncbi:MAG: hypothetical protein V7640_582 [Betaproteobacteria bacterium]|jgi:hypothetical protein